MYYLLLTLQKPTEHGRRHTIADVVVWALSSDKTMTQRALPYSTSLHNISYRPTDTHQFDKTTSITSDIDITSPTVLSLNKHKKIVSLSFYPFVYIYVYGLYTSMPLSHSTNNRLYHSVSMGTFIHSTLVVLCLLKSLYIPSLQYFYDYGLL